MKTAYFIFGPEGSGTYMLAEAFVSVGCNYVDRAVEYVPDLSDEKIVARMSLPCAGKFIPPSLLYAPYRRAGYECIFMTIFRDANASRKSVMRRDSTRVYSQVWEEYKKAMEYITGFLSSGIAVSYEAFVDSPGYRKWLFEFYGLPAPTGEWFNANEKYYG
ncbi:MAG: hypothetical protein JRJ45_05015 [Deltaproteobacteria bacterium]|nr:hypothetical protein [Deltaproteobacteria bacterium]